MSGSLGWLGRQPSLAGICLAMGCAVAGCAAAGSGGHADKPNRVGAAHSTPVPSRPRPSPGAAAPFSVPAIGGDPAQLAGQLSMAERMLAASAAAPAVLARQALIAQLACLRVAAHPGWADTDPALQYSGNWSHVANQSYTGGDYKNTESFSNQAGDSLTVPFNGTAIRWIGSQTSNHGLADVHIDDTKQATVDASGSQNQAVLFAKSGLSDGPHTLKIVVDGTHSSGSTDNYVSIDAIDVPTGSAAANPTYPVVPPQPGTAITLNGRDSHIIVANYKLGDSQLQYSTSEIMTDATIGGRDVEVLYGDQGSDGETVLRYASRPTVQATGGNVTTTWDPASGDLRLNYTHNGLIRAMISGGGSRPLLLLDRSGPSWM